MLVCVVFNYHEDFGSNFHFFFPHQSLTLLVHKNRCCPERCNCVDQEKAVMSAGGRAGEHFETLRIIFLNQVLAGLEHTFYRCLQSHRLGGRGRQKTLRV